MSILEMARLFRRRYRWVVGVGLFACAVLLVFGLTRPVTFQSTAKVFVSTQTAANAGDLSQGNTYLQAIVASYTDLVTTPLVLEPVRKQVAPQDTFGELASSVSATAPTDTVLIEISVVRRSGSQAADIANAIATRLSVVVGQLTPSTTRSDSQVKVTLVQPATPPSVPYSPNTALLALVAVLGALTAGAFAGILRDYLDMRVSTKDESEVTYGLPLLAQIPFASAADMEAVPTEKSHSGPYAESLRVLRANLHFAMAGDGAKLIGCTSAMESEGKSTTVVQLAIALAMTGVQVCLVDADLRRPRVADYLGLEGSIGFSDVVVGDASVESSVQRWGSGSLSVLPAGSAVPNPTELLQSSGTTDLMLKLSQDFDLVLLDMPPVLAIADALVLSGKIDGVVLVSDVTKTKRTQLIDAVRALDMSGSRKLGLILTKVRRGDGGYGYGYGYGFNEARSASK